MTTNRSEDKVERLATTLRNALLPKLISGGIWRQKVDQFTEQTVTQGVLDPAPQLANGNL